MLRNLWSGTKQVFNQFFEDDAMTLGAALAFYGALSLAPLLILLMAVLGLVTTDQQQQQIVTQIKSTVGEQAGSTIDGILQNARTNRSGSIVSLVVGTATLVLGASAVFAQLQASMNRIWGVEAKPGGGVGEWLRKRLLALGVVAVIGVLLLASMIITAGLSMMLSGQGVIWDVVNFVLSAGIYILLFATVYKMLPDVRITWRTTWVGATVTAVLFALGKLAIGTYIGYASVGSAYGAAGSLIALLVWVYYSALILFVGAEVTEVYADRSGSDIEPDRHAIPISTRAPDKAVHHRRTHAA